MTSDAVLDQSGAPGAQLLPMNVLRRTARLWPRTRIDPERVALFIELYSDGGIAALPPIDVVPDGELFEVCDGHHRTEALRQLRVAQVPVAIVGLSGSVAQTVYEHALRTATAAAQPLTRAERRTAVARLLSDQPERSDRDIARLCGVSPTTVGATRRRQSTTPRGSAPIEPGSQYLAAVGANELAERLAKSIATIYAERGLMDYAVGDRTGRRLATALTTLHGPDEARRWAARLREWADRALAELDR